jgi:predicted nuclease of restriction endonuclease-like RecB superfamily
VGSSATEGYRPDLGHYVRSKWEANVARWLLWKGKEYCYEPEVFQVGGRGYCPDFWVYDWKIWLEVKGLWSGGAREKVGEFLRDGSRKLVVVEKELYERLGREYRKAYRNGSIQNLSKWES